MADQHRVAPLGVERAVGAIGHLSRRRCTPQSSAHARRRTSTCWCAIAGSCAVWSMASQHMQTLHSLPQRPGLQPCPLRLLQRPRVPLLAAIRRQWKRHVKHLRRTTRPRPRPMPPPAGREHAEPARRSRSLRAELDRLDDAMHDLLMQPRRRRPARRRDRTARAVVALPARAGGGDLRAACWPAITAPLPPHSVLPHLWRELLAATTGMQGRFAIAVCEHRPGPALSRQLAREHFGALTPLRVHRSPAQAIAEVSAGAPPPPCCRCRSETNLRARPGGPRCCTRTSRASTSSLACPSGRRGPRAPRRRRPWWSPPPRPTPPEPTGSLLGLELAPDMSRARLASALTAADLSPGVDHPAPRPGGAQRTALIDVAAWFPTTTRGLGEFLRRGGARWCSAPTRCRSEANP